MIDYVKATNVAIKLDNKVFGCAKSASFSTKRATTSVTCAATGSFDKKLPGLESWDGSLSAVLRLFDAAGVAANVTLREMYASLRAGTEVEIEFELGDTTSPTYDYYIYTSKAYLTEVAITVPEGDEVVTWTATLVGSEPLISN
jgi:hypothetical protein